MGQGGVKGRADEKMLLKRHFTKKSASNAIFTFCSEESDMRPRHPAPLTSPNGATAGSLHETTTEPRYPHPLRAAHTLPPVGRVGLISGRGGGLGMLIVGGLRP